MPGTDDQHVIQTLAPYCADQTVPHDNFATAILVRSVGRKYP